LLDEGAVHDSFAYHLFAMTDESISFGYAEGFERGEVSGDVRLGKLEMMYEELFAEVIEDGIITQEERARLDKAADSLGLDRARLRRLEQALQAAWEARHKIVIRELYVGEAGAPAASIEPLAAPTDGRTLALQRRVRELEARVVALERELEEARSQVAIEVDLSDVAAKAGPEDDPVELGRRLRHAPRDTETLHALYRALAKAQDVDRQYTVAHALLHLGAADDAERRLHSAHQEPGLIRPKLSLSRDAWVRLLAHPEQEPVTGDIFAVVAPAVLLGRIAALRRDKKLPKLDPAARHDPAQSTVQAVRCFAWASAILGTSAPPLYVDPEFPGVAELVPAMPPATRLGARALSGRSAGELAFLAGRQLAYHREEHIVRLLMPDVTDLEAVFLAALSIGNPGLPMNEKMRELVMPIARAIEPILEPSSLDRLRGHFLRFVEEGGRTNLQRWATSVDRTAARAGLVLANDLGAAEKVLRAEDPARVDEQMDDLYVFATSERYARLRKQLGIAVG
jgi:hypothetical protein